MICLDNNLHFEYFYLCHCTQQKKLMIHITSNYLLLYNSIRHDDRSFSTPENKSGSDIEMDDDYEDDDDDKSGGELNNDKVFSGESGNEGVDYDNNEGYDPIAGENFDDNELLDYSMKR